MPSLHSTKSIDALVRARASIRSTFLAVALVSVSCPHVAWADGGHPIVAPAFDAAPMPTSQPAGISALHSDLKFSVATGARLEPRHETGAAGMLTRQTLRLVPALESAARGLFPEIMSRIGQFDVYIATSTGIESRSSASGKIAINSAVGELRLTDDSLALVIAREMGHVLGGHHDDNSVASLLTSVIMNILIPGSSLIKSALSFAGSELAAATGADRQAVEADEIAIRLLETAGYRRQNLALSLATEPMMSESAAGNWMRAFRKSAAGIVASARPVVHPAASAADANAVANAEPLVPTAHAGDAMPLSREPLIRVRPSGIAGPLLLGGYAVPSRRID